MNAKRRETKSFQINITTHDKLSGYCKTSGKTMISLIDEMVDWIPVLDTCQKLELTIEEAIARLNQTYLPNKPRSSKNRNEFSNWLEKLIKHNENSPVEKRVFLTQRLFLNLIGGNVNTITDIFKQHAAMIAEHNEKMELDESSNRVLSHAIRKEYGTIADWLKKILS